VARGFTALGQGWLSLDRDLLLPDFAQPAKRAWPPYEVPLGGRSRSGRPLVGERLDQAIAEQVAIHFAIPIDTVTAAVRVIQHGLGDGVLVGRITLSEAHERVRAKEQTVSTHEHDPR